MTDSAYLTALELLDAFRTKQLSPVEHLETLIARVETLEPELNAVVGRRYDEALVEARASAQRYARGEALVLDGMPVAAKEEHPMRGRSWAQGSLAYGSLVAAEDQHQRRALRPEQRPDLRHPVGIGPRGRAASIRRLPPPSFGPAPGPGTFDGAGERRVER